MKHDDVTVRIYGTTGWETLGANSVRGVIPESVSLSSNEWGSDKASFDLRRPIDGNYVDLRTWNPVEVEVGGQVVWTGRIVETPTRDGDDQAINVQAEGWQYHLDDDLYQPLYVHTDLTAWQDFRSFPTAPLATYFQAGTVSAGDGTATIGWPNDTVIATSSAAIFIDFGAASPWINKIDVVVKTSNNSSSIKVQVYAIEADGSTPNLYNQPLTTVGAGPTLISVTPSPAARGAIIAISYSGTSTTSSEVWAQITGVALYAAAGYESAGASVLTADSVLKDALTHAPLLSADTSQIAAQSFHIPDLASTDFQTPREAVSAVNAFHNNLLMVDTQKRLVFQALPTSPVLEIGAWQPSQFDDASLNSGDEIYNRVIVQGSGPDGLPVSVVRTQTGTAVDSAGFTRAKALPIDAALTTAVGQQIGDTFLQAHKTTPMKGSISVIGQGAVRTRFGSKLHPAYLLTQTNQLLRLADRIDPDTGGIGRDARLSTVTYTHADRTAALELDNTRKNFDAFLARYNLVAGQVRS